MTGGTRVGSDDGDLAQELLYTQVPAKGKSGEGLEV
jgi:hypothetical protein